MGNKIAGRENRKTLTEAEINVLIANTKFTRDEIIEWHKGFILDCPSGKLGKDKFIEIYKQFLMTGKADKFCGYVFKTFDTDNSGSIDFTEFLIAISTASQDDPREKLKMAFNIYDIDKNGKVDKKEMEKIIEAIYELKGQTNRNGIESPSEIVKKIMSRLDTNNDGFLSKEEFIEGCLNDESIKEFHIFDMVK